MTTIKQTTTLADTAALLDDGTLVFCKELPQDKEVLATWKLDDLPYVEESHEFDPSTWEVINIRPEAPAWINRAAEIKRVAALAPVMPESTDGWFALMENLVEVDLANLDMSACESSERMFYGCKSLKSLDISSWDMFECGDMIEMFAECVSLETVALFELDSSRNGGTCPNGMFYHCRSLKSVDISRWDVSGIDSFTSMFSGCTSLTEAKLPSWDYLRSYIEDFDSPAEAFEGEEFAWMFVDCDSSLGAPLERLGCPHEVLYNKEWKPFD
ncbi:BspA family leucine-rich repeat surface protein [Paratractidigestivibacter sp.]|uniref:BspA family leucine-rich repeat surface protein n=1 Tax=Paratractidigestivibacter sp. TaxID=2847316 RepID=UPI002ACB08C7|nr:BspA family leucine-rich repeat surface protein [Paratractidigestivibacter sp.]